MNDNVQVYFTCLENDNVQVYLTWLENDIVQVYLTGLENDTTYNVAVSAVSISKQNPGLKNGYYAKEHKELKPL